MVITQSILSPVHLNWLVYIKFSAFGGASWKGAQIFSKKRLCNILKSPYILMKMTPITRNFIKINILRKVLLEEDAAGI